MIKNVVLVSGPSGCDRDAYIKEAIGTRDDTNYYQVFDYMKFVAAVDGSALSETNIDDPNKEPHIKWRTEAFDLIAEEIESSNKTNHIISTTCIFDYPSGVIEEGITGELFNVIKPNTVIVFIDDLIAIKKRLKNDDRWKRIFRESGGEASLSILAHWRQAATDLLEKLANTYKKLHCDSQTGFVENFFIFAKQHPKETFLSLIFETKTKYQIYLSYPITDAEDNGDFEGLKRVMSDYFVVFDPYTIKEWQIVDKYDDAIEGRLSQIEFEDIIIQTSEIGSAIPAIRKQLVKRDLAIIDNADGVVVYHKNRKEPSAGVMVEMVHARAGGKPIFGYYPFDRPSPFMEYYFSKGEMPTSFNDIKDLIYHVRKHFYPYVECER